MSFDLDAFVEDCRRAETRDEVVAIVTRAVEQRAELLRALGPVEEQLTRTFHVAPERTVQIIGWAPGIRAPAHEHRMWAVIGTLAGCEDNGFWRRTDQAIERTGGASVHEGQVLALDDDVIHDLSNPREAFSVGIHVYGGDIIDAPRSTWHPLTMAEERFDSAKVDRIVAAFNARQRAEAVPFAAANVPRIMAEVLAELGLGASA